MKLAPVALAFDGRDPTNRAPRGISGLLAVGKGLDLVWTGDGLYLMKEKGKFRPLWRSPGVNDWAEGGFGSVCFDGRYAWASFVLNKKNPTLLVIDPEKEKVWDVSAAEGLPQAPVQELAEKFATAALVAAPLEPGRACTAGAFLGRAWVATATFDPATGKAAFKIVHEARDTHDPTDKEQWARTTTAFAPFYIYTLTGTAGADGKPPRRVLIGRGGGSNFKVSEHPLTFDPDRGTVEVLKARIWNGPTRDRSATAGGAVYFMESYPNPDSPNHPLTHVARVGFPGPDKAIVLAPLPPSVGQMSRTAVRGDKLHVVLEQHEVDFGKGGAPVRTCQWWTADLDGKNPRRVATGLPPIGGVWESSHYGFVALVDSGMNKPAVLHTVEVLDPAPKNDAPTSNVHPRVSDAPARVPDRYHSHRAVGGADVGSRPGVRPARPREGSAGRTPRSQVARGTRRDMGRAHPGRSGSRRTETAGAVRCRRRRRTDPTREVAQGRRPRSRPAGQGRARTGPGTRRQRDQRRLAAPDPRRPDHRRPGRGRRGPTRRSARGSRSTRRRSARSSPSRRS